MKIAIIGGGTVGEILALTFTADKHDVVIVDTSAKTLARLRDRVDVMTVVGNGADYDTLDAAGVNEAKMFIAVGRNDTENIHACHIASNMGVPNIICRLGSRSYFAKNGDFAPRNLGINYVVVPYEECVNKIMNVMDTVSSLEKITFSTPEASVAAYTVSKDSLLNGVKLADFPEPALLRSVRFATLIRDEKLIAPHGDTVLQAGDEIYLAGLAEGVDAMIQWAYPNEKKMHRVIIAGGSHESEMLAAELAKEKFEIRLIEKNHALAEDIMNRLNTKMMVVNGDPSENDVLEEAGVAQCDVFIASGENDENNILSCILAKRMGARKTIALTNKKEYFDLVRKMDFIDCGFSRWVVASNSILRHISMVNQVHISATLHRAKAIVSEFVIKEKSAVCSRQINECKFPSSTVLALVFRDNNVLTPYGELVLQEGDTVAAITTPETEKELAKLFS